MTSFLSSHSKSFVHLHLHTQYSLLDGAIRTKDLFERAKELGMPAVAQTDHGNMFGVIDFYQRAKKAGIRPILGSEIYFTAGSRFDRRETKKSRILSGQDEQEGRHQIHHLVLLCKNLTGYQNLCKLLSKAYLEGFYYKPRTDVDLLREHSEGLIATTACLKGEVNYNIFTGQEEKSLLAIEKLREIYKDDFYLEIQENGLSEQGVVNREIIRIGKERGIPLVATNDCHYLYQEDAAAQEVLLCVQTGKTFADEKRMKLSSQEFYFKSSAEMRDAFKHLPEACDNTLLIADKCDVEFKWTDDKGRQIYHLPDFQIPTEESDNDFFKRMTLEGLEERFIGPHFKDLVNQENWKTGLKQTYLDRLDGEIEMIIKMGFVGYFLIVSDFIKWAKGEKIPVGPGRGSGAGSLVAYSLQITNINPLPYNLLFERFINPERVTLPDFDIDFCQERRQEVIDYVTQKYGKERVGQIITFGKLQAKAVLRDVSRVFNLPYSEADMLAKLVPDELGINLEKALDLEPKLNEWSDKDPKIRQIIKISKRLEGLLRHASIHAAGVIITNKPLVNYCPLYKGREGEQVVQFDKDFSEQIGLVKFDFLGLKTLTMIEKTSAFIRRDEDVNFDIEAIDMADKKVYDFISTGSTVGVFQLESSGMRDLCMRLKPDNIEDITAINALYRPGPLGSGMVDDFIEIKHGRRPAHYVFTTLKPVLQDTYGIITYQEQVQNVARIVAGYSLGQADILRRAMGKKKADVMDEHREIFAKGAEGRGYNRAKALELFDLMAKFAEYGFNKSHAVAYAFIAYQTAYLKCYYPAPFYAALLSTELSNADKVTNYIKDAKEFKVETLPPDINESIWPFNVVGTNIRFGLGAVKNVGENAVTELVREREANGPFKGLGDFCERVDYKMMNRRMLESLVKVGAFDNSEKKMNRKTMFENLEKIMNYSHRRKDEKSSGQMGLFNFDLDKDKALAQFLNVQEVEDFTDKEKLSYEQELIGIYVSGHPLDKCFATMKELVSLPIVDVHDLTGHDKRDTILGGIISHKKVLLTKKGDRMAFATLEDLTSKIECIIFPRTFAEYGHLLEDDSPLLLFGSVNLAESPRKFFPSKIIRLEEGASNMVKSIEINIPGDIARENILNNIKEILQGHRGAIPATLNFDFKEGKVVVPLGDDFLVDPSPMMAFKVNDLLQQNSVRYHLNGAQRKI